MLLWYCVLLLLFYSAVVLADETNEIPAIEPEFLDMLLASGQYEEFAEHMGIENVDLVRPSNADSKADPMFNKGLFEGDMLLTPQQSEQARQFIKFETHTSYKWPNKLVPYVISNDFTSANKDNIQKAIKVWNNTVECLKYEPRKTQKDYVFFFPGDGCYSNAGKIGGKQSLSLHQDGCFRQGTILHEMDHAAGCMHEHTRSDRDDYLEMLWDNIPKNWKAQYEKTNTKDYGLHDKYDYYSVMHYPVPAPGTNKPAYRVIKSGIDENRIGQRTGFSQSDLNKLKERYCK